MPGITFLRPMFAVLRTPQRIFLDMMVHDKWRIPGVGASRLESAMISALD
jgi:hypothetical protein